MAQAYPYKSLMASHLHDCMVPAKKRVVHEFWQFTYHPLIILYQTVIKRFRIPSGSEGHSRSSCEGHAPAI